MSRINFNNDRYLVTAGLRNQQIVHEEKTPMTEGDRIALKAVKKKFKTNHPDHKFETSVRTSC